DPLRRQSARHQPENLDLAVGEREMRTRSLEQDARGDRPARDRTDREERRVAHVHRTRRAAPACAGAAPAQSTLMSETPSAGALARPALARTDDLMVV